MSPFLKHFIYFLPKILKQLLRGLELILDNIFCGVAVMMIIGESTTLVAAGYLHCVSIVKAHEALVLAIV